MEVNLTNIYKRYKGLWVALNKPLARVLSSGRDAKEVYNQTTRKGYKEPVMFKVPTKNISYIGSFSLINEV